MAGNRYEESTIRSDHLPSSGQISVEGLPHRRMQWLEAGTDLQLQSIEITQCIPSTDRASAAEVRGRLQVNGEGDYPFVIWATDAGRPGSALDRIEIEVNTPAAREGAQGQPSDDTFDYQASGNLVAGDFQWIIADIETGS